MNKKLYVALHAQSPEQILVEGGRISDAGADGVFVVNNGFYINYAVLFAAASQLKELSPPWFFVGINPLDLDTVEAIQKMKFLGTILDGLWVDSGEIYETEVEAGVRADVLFALNTFKKTFFGSFAFKTDKKEVKDLVAVARVAAEFFDVPVTSGPATGVAADVEKIKTIKNAIPKKLFALASGITEENVHQFLPFVDYFIVGTSLQADPKDPYHYNKKKIERLVQIIKKA